MFAVNLDGHVTEFETDEVSHAVVNKRVAAALVLVHAPSQGSKSQEEGSIWTGTPPWGWRDRLLTKVTVICNEVGTSMCARICNN